MFRKARCLVVNFLLLVNMHIACPVSDSNDIWSIFRGNHRLDQTFFLSWNSSSILPSLKHPGFPCLNCNSVLLICSSRALPHTFCFGMLPILHSSPQPFTTRAVFQWGVSPRQSSFWSHLDRRENNMTVSLLIPSFLTKRWSGKNGLVLQHNQQEETCNGTSSFLHGQRKSYTNDGLDSEECWLNSVSVFQMST